MKLNKDDLIKHLALSEHTKLESPNIGIIGDDKYFKRKMKSILRRTKHYDFMYANKELTRYTLINNNIETTYIKIENLSDLENTYFRRYLC